MVQKNKYNTLNTVCYSLSKVFKIDKPIIFIYFGYVAARLGSNLLWLFFLPSLIQLLTGGAPLSQLLLTVVAIVLALLICHLIERLCNQLYTPRMSRLRVRLSQELDELMLDMPYTSFENPDDQNFFENANSVIGQSNGGLSGMIVYSFELLEEIAAFVIYIAVSFYVNWLIFLLITAATIVNFVLTERTNRRNHENTVKMSEQNRVMEFLNRCINEEAHAKDMRVYNMFRWFSHRMKLAIKDYHALALKNHGNNMRLSLLNVFISAFSDIVIYAVLITSVIFGALTVANFSLNFSIVYAISGRVSGIMQGILRLQSFNLAMNDYRKVLETYGEHISEQENNSAELIGFCPPKIGFKNVSFMYPNTQKYVLKNLSFTIESGERISLVGENGAGKSTIVKLLCRLYEPTEGYILLNGRNYLEYSEDTYRKLLSVVFQDTINYAFMIKENVSMRPENMTDETKVTAALEKAGLMDKIKTLPNGYDSNLIKYIYPDAVALSGGENQKLAISRALYKNTPIMILDEPTAALDAFTESYIYRTFADMTNGKSAVFISHRLASSKFCDRIIMLKDGRTEGIGTHDELLRSCEQYAELYNIQAQGYVEEAESV